MPISIEEVPALRTYIDGVMGRAAHHAGNVEAIGLAVIGGVLWRADDLEVRSQDGEMKNVLWFRVEGKRYALSYNHESETIEVRNRTTHGDTLRSFDNSTPITDVKDFFADL
jgi:hypothetical protein